MTQAVVGAGRMPNGGRIVNIGSIASKVLIPPPVYSAAKATTDALTTLWAGEVSFLLLLFLLMAFFRTKHSKIDHLTEYCIAWQESWDYRKYPRTRSSSNRYVEGVSGEPRRITNSNAAFYV